MLHYKYCPLCGARLTERENEEQAMIPYCAVCGNYWYDSYPSCVIILTYNNKGEMVVTSQEHISREHYVMTSGYISPGETAEAAAVREVKEELGLTVCELSYDQTYWYAKKGMLMHAFFARTEDTEFTLNEEVQIARWVPVGGAMEFLGGERPGSTDVAMWHRFCELHGIQEGIR